MAVRLIYGDTFKKSSAYIACKFSGTLSNTKRWYRFHVNRRTLNHSLISWTLEMQIYSADWCGITVGAITMLTSRVFALFNEISCHRKWLPLRTASQISSSCCAYFRFHSLLLCLFCFVFFNYPRKYMKT